MNRSRGEPNVDSDTLLAIENGNKDVISQVKTMLSDTTTDIKEYIELHVSPLKDDVTRLRTDVHDLYNKDREMRDRVGALEQRQATDEGQRAGSETAFNNQQSRSQTAFAKYGVIIAFITLLVGLAAGYFL